MATTATETPPAGRPWRKDRLDTLAVVLLLAFCLFWGGQQVLIKATLPELPPIFQAALRFAGATVLLALWSLWRRVPLFRPDGSLWAGLLAGLLFAGEFVFMYLGLEHTTASRLTVFLYTSPFWVVAIVPLLVPDERLRSVQWVGLVLAFFGVLFALREGFLNPGPGASVQGDLLALLAGAAWGLTTVVIRVSRLAQLSAEKILFYQVGLSALLLPLLSLAMGETWTWSWSGFALVSVAVQTAIGAFASYLAWMWLLVHYPATRMATFVFLTPVFAMLIGMLWLGEVIGLSLIVALVMVGTGIVLINRRA